MPRKLRRASGGFIARDIFPDSEPPSIGTVLAAAERQGFEVRDVECMREHYGRTLRLWLARLEGRFDDALGANGPPKSRAAWYRALFDGGLPQSA